MKDFIKLADENLIHTYNRYPIVFEKGEGVYLFDSNGKKYLDCAAGIAVCALGHSNHEFNKRIKGQIDKLLHVSNYFYNIPMAEAAAKLAEASGMDRVFFTNSGTEAIEGALKLARKYAHQKGNKDKSEIIAMSHSFHGRSMGAVSVTATKSYREPFEPLISGVKFAEYNDLESVKALVSEKTCAVLLEVVQGEGGLYVAKKKFLEGIRKLCTEKDIVLIFDEIQCGMGRTGSMFAYQNYNVIPDVVTTAKGLGGGIPVGAFAAKGKMSEVLVPGDHGTTYGGNPLAATAVCAIFDLYKKENILENVKKISKYLDEKLDILSTSKTDILERRGTGLMQGLVLRKPVGEIIQMALEKGLVVIAASDNILRMVPPLVITESEIDEMINIIDNLLS